MKKIVRLTESDLVRLVKRVISEQQTTSGRTSQNSWLDITNFIDFEGNSGCAKPFTLVGNDLFSKFDQSFFDVITKNGKHYIKYITTETQTQLDTGKNYSQNPGRVGNCSINEYEGGLFGKSRLGKYLKENPNKFIQVTRVTN